MDKTKDNRYRLIEYSIPSISNDPKGFEPTNNEFSVEGEKIDHYKYCKSCENGNAIRELDNGFRQWIHEPTKDNPSYDLIETSWYQ